MISTAEKTALLSIVLGTLIVIIALVFSMSEASKRQHELKMKCTEFEASNTPVCLKAAYSY